MIEFSQKEIEFLKKLEEARIATSHDNIPHVKPVSFVFEDNAIIIATDYNTRAYTNIKSNSQTSIVIDLIFAMLTVHTPNIPLIAFLIGKLEHRNDNYKNEQDVRHNIK